MNSQQPTANSQRAPHTSVLMSEVLKALDVQSSDTVVDATLGGAGHFAAFLPLLGVGGIIVGIDADAAAVERARIVYAEDRRPERPVAHLVNDNFRNLSRILERLNIAPVNKILFDLGWSGYQIASPRGFSFSALGGPASGGQDQPLLMTYGEGGETAADIVNTSSEENLANLIYTYGEERFARSIARYIVAARSRARILTTGALVEAILAGTPRWYHDGKSHPATKTFQALRIAVNDELGALREGLAAALEALAPGGRLAIISFHSIEDRIVKGILHDAMHAHVGTLSPKKPIVASRTEVLENRCARSAKLRVFERATAAHVEQLEPASATLAYAQ